MNRLVQWKTATMILCLGLAACSTGAKKSLSSDEKATLLIQAAMGSIQEGDPTGALITLRDAEQLAPKNPYVFLTRAIALLSKRDLDAALQSAQRAVQLAPEKSESQTTLGRIYLEKGMVAQAEKPLKKAAADHLYRESYKAKTNLGILYYKTGQYADSRRWLDDAVADAPNDACMGFYYRGHINLKEGKVLAAAKDYENATKKLCANFVEAHLAVATAYEKSGQIDKARKKLLSIRDTFPNNPVSETAMERLKQLK